VNNKHERFDPDKLFARKDNFCGFSYCPLCGKVLTRGEREGRVRAFCADDECGYVFYQNPVPAAGGIIVENDRILLVKRAHPPRIGWWCLPAGYMEWNEHPEMTAVREVEEETGLQVKLDGFFEVYSGADDPRSNAVLLLYLATVTGGELRAADDAMDVRFFAFDDLPENIAFEAHCQALIDYDQRIRNPHSRS